MTQAIRVTVWPRLGWAQSLKIAAVSLLWLAACIAALSWGLSHLKGDAQLIPAGIVAVLGCLCAGILWLQLRRIVEVDADRIVFRRGSTQLAVIEKARISRIEIVFVSLLATDPKQFRYISSYSRHNTDHKLTIVLDDGSQHAYYMDQTDALILRDALSALGYSQVTQRIAETMQ